MSACLSGIVVRNLISVGAPLLLGLLCLGAAQRHAAAEPARRYATDDRGNFVIVGNTVGHDCRAPAPVVGDPGPLCGSPVTADADSGIDGYWRSDFPASGQAMTDNVLTPIGPSSSRSTAGLTIPAGATVSYARLYWASLRSTGGDTATIEHPANLRRLDVRATGQDFKTVTAGGIEYFQGSADVTPFIQSIGSGAYRVSGFNSFSLRNQTGVLVTSDVTFSGWHLVVFYKLDSEPVRNLTLFDGFDLVQGRTLSTQLSGFLVPNMGAEGRLGLVAYEGDADLTGDSVRVNGTALGNAQNPANNFFNSTRSQLGNPLSVRGDLPQLSGSPGSMSGIDIDVVDITPLVAAGARQASLETTSTTDEILLGTMVTGFSSIRPVLSGANKTFTNLTRNDGRVLPGDVIEYTITVGNNGSDAAINVVLRDPLPQQVSFVPNSLLIASGPNMGNKTDVADADQAEYVMNTRTVVFRLGTGANTMQGGRIAVGDTPSVVRFRVTVNAGATGLVANQGQMSAQGETSTMQGSPEPSTWGTGNGTVPNAPTVFRISACGSSAECPVTAPICDTTAMPQQCVCRMDSDCPSGLICNPMTRSCTECSATNTMKCQPSTVGGVCLPGGVCGCSNNTDCGGRSCDMAARTCPSVATDLSVSLSRSPTAPGLPPASAVAYRVTVRNTSSVDIVGATLSDSFQRSPGVPAAEMWSCMATDGAQCPVASGTGPLPTSFSLPAGGQLQYMLQSTLPTAQMSATVDYTVTVTPPRGYTDSNPIDNFASDSILVLPGGPDLGVTVVETTSVTEPTITYIIDVHNNGPGTAEGATVTYQMPQGATLRDVTAGQGWLCSTTMTSVSCTRTAPIGPNMDAEPIVLKVIPPGGVTTIPVDVTVNGTDAAGNPVGDPDPSNNTVRRETALQEIVLSGGGFSIGCSLGSAGVAPVPSTLLLGLLLGAAGLVRRGRSRRPIGTA